MSCSEKALRRNTEFGIQFCVSSSKDEYDYLLYGELFNIDYTVYMTPLIINILL